MEEEGTTYIVDPRRKSMTSLLPYMVFTAVVLLGSWIFFLFSTVGTISNSKLKGNYARVEHTRYAYIDRDISFCQYAGVMRSADGHWIADSTPFHCDCSYYSWGLLGSSETHRVEWGQFPAKEGIDTQYWDYFEGLDQDLFNKPWKKGKAPASGMSELKNKAPKASGMAEVGSKLENTKDALLMKGSALTEIDERKDTKDQAPKLGKEYSDAELVLTLRDWNGKLMYAKSDVDKMTETQLTDALLRWSAIDTLVELGVPKEEFETAVRLEKNGHMNAFDDLLEKYKGPDCQTKFSLKNAGWANCALRKAFGKEHNISIVKLIGAGSHSSIFHTRHAGKEFALKFGKVCPQRDFDNSNTEVVIANKYMGSCADIDAQGDVLKDSEGCTLFILPLEQMKHTLDEYIVRFGSSFTLKRRLQAAVSLIQEVLKFQNLGFIHGELTDSNVMCVDESCMNLKLVDYDYGCEWRQAQDCPLNFHTDWSRYRSQWDTWQQYDAELREMGMPSSGKIGIPPLDQYGELHGPRSTKMVFTSGDQLKNFDAFGLGKILQGVFPNNDQTKAIIDRYLLTKDFFSRNINSALEEFQNLEESIPEGDAQVAVPDNGEQSGGILNRRFPIGESGDELLDECIDNNGIPRWCWRDASQKRTLPEGFCAQDGIYHARAMFFLLLTMFEILRQMNLSLGSDTVSVDRIRRQTHNLKVYFLELCFFLMLIYLPSQKDIFHIAPLGLVDFCGIFAVLLFFMPIDRACKRLFFQQERRRFDHLAASRGRESSHDTTNGVGTVSNGHSALSYLFGGRGKSFALLPGKEAKEEEATEGLVDFIKQDSDDDL